MKYEGQFQNAAVIFWIKRKGLMLDWLVKFRIAGIN